MAWPLQRGAGAGQVRSRRLAHPGTCCGWAGGTSIIASGVAVLAPAPGAVPVAGDGPGGLCSVAPGRPPV